MIENISISLNRFVIIIFAILMTIFLGAYAIMQHFYKNFEPSAFLNERGMIAISTEMKESAKEIMIYYGHTKSHIISDKSIKIRDIQNPGTDISFGSNEEYALIVADGNDNIIVFPSPYYDHIRYIDLNNVPYNLYSSCWPGSIRKALFIGTEDAGGLLYYDKGWKWSQCGD